MRLAFFGSSLVSAYWNGAATYYRGLLRSLHARGHSIAFYEPDAYDRQRHRDMSDPDWARIIVYSAEDTEELEACLEEAAAADVVIKASRVGVFDEWLESRVADLGTAGPAVVFWDVDAPATLERIRRDPGDPFRTAVPRYDLVLVYGGGPRVVNEYRELGARDCVPIYNALDPCSHHPVPPDPRFRADLALLANRLPDRERRVEEFFFEPARLLPEHRFLLGGSGWGDRPMPDNVRYVEYVPPRDHNAFNGSARAVLNVTRASMVRYGHSPATRVFEAAGAGACLISDHWDGIEAFLEPGREVLIARSGENVAEILAGLTTERARRIGSAALRRVLNEHTYDRRAARVERVLVHRLGLRPTAPTPSSAGVERP